MKRRLLSLITALALCLGLLPVGVLATEANSEEAIALAVESVSVVPQTDLPGNDELFTGYVEQLFYGSSMSVFGVAAGARLTGANAKLYSYLKEEIVNIANGTQASAQFSFDAATLKEWDVKLDYTKSDLGLSEGDAFTEGNNLTDAAGSGLQNAFRQEIDYSLVLDSLMADCPYELYWFDKTSGGNILYGFSGITNNTLSISRLTLCLSVASAYAGSEPYTVDTAKTGAASAAAANAAALVARHAGKSDVGKLLAYKRQICVNTDYNHAAADQNYTGGYGDPWQLIYVFDDDPNTKVVCEGYAKAFQYLCDMSTFSGDVTCYTVTGYMSGGTGAGPHMWNIVTIDGNNYLVDVTNSDADTIGVNGELFLAGSSTPASMELTVTANDGTSSNITLTGYSFPVGRTTVSFCYNKDLIWPDSVLTLAPSSHVFSLADATISASTVTYNGRAQTPAPSVYLGGILLTKGTDYVVSYEDNVDAGSAKIIITPAEGSKFTGETTGTFTINPLELDVYIKDGNIHKTYDATTEITWQEDFNSNALSLVLRNKVGDDDVTATAEHFNFDTPDARNGKPITATGITLSGADKDNYTFADAYTTLNVGRIEPSNAISSPIAFYAYYLFDDAGSATVNLADIVAKAAAKAIPNAVPGTTSYAYSTGSINKQPDRLNTTTGVLTQALGVTQTAGDSPYIVIASTQNFGDITIQAHICRFAKYPLSITGITVQDAVYDGKGHTGYTGTPVAKLIGTPAMADYDGPISATYKKLNEENKKFEIDVDGLPTEVGEYRLYFNIPEDATIDGNPVEIDPNKWFEFSIKAGDAAVTKAPTAKPLTYTGEKQELVTAGTAVGGTMQYKLGDGDWSEAIPSATDAGTYTVSYRVKSPDGTKDTNPVSLTVTIAKAIAAFSTVPTEKTDLIYRSSEQELVNAGSSAAGTVQYSLDNQNWSAAIPAASNAGTYTIYCKIVAADSANYVDSSVSTLTVTIAKADPSVTAPEAKAGLIYTGNVHSLITAGTATGGTMQYSLTENDSYSAVIPTGTNAGTYTVWYKVVGDANHNDAAPASISVTIAKATLFPDISGNTTKVYDGTCDAPGLTIVLEGIKGNDDVTATADSIAFTSADAGEKTILADGITISGRDAGNYELFADNIQVDGKIEKATPVVTAPTARTLYYTGEAQALVNAGSTTGGTMVYCTVENGTYGSIPTAEAAGEYTVWYKVIGGNNYTDTAPASLTVSIGKAQPTVIAPAAKALYYTGEVQALVNAGSTTGGTMVYCTEENGTYGSIPEGSNVGTYTVWYKVVGDDNYKDVAPASISVTISAAENKLTTSVAGKTGLVYTGSAQALITAGEAKFGALQYRLDDGAWSESIPAATNAGTYTVSYKVDSTVDYAGITGSVEVTIAKADPTVTAPAANAGLIYTGSAQALITAGTATGGTMQYSLSENGSYSADIPTTVNAGTYTIWYKVVGDANHNDAAPASISVTIAKAAITFTASLAAKTYDAKTDNAVVAGVTFSGLKNTDALTLGTDYTVSAGSYDSADAGERSAVVTVTLKDTAAANNYALASASVSAGGTINKATVTVKADNKSISVNGTLPELTYTVTGLKGSDTLTKTPTLSFSGEVDVTKAGTAAILISDAAVSDNYTLVYETGTLTISNPSSGGSGGSVAPGGPGGGSEAPEEPEEEPEVIAPTKEFDDVHGKDHWAKDAIDFVVGKGLFTGKSDTIFDPDGNTTRAQIVTVLWRLAGSPVVNYLLPFEDVAAEAYYTEAVRWAASTGIVTGYDARTFGPNDDITREQLASILWRYAKHAGEDVSVGESTNILSYADAFSISEYACAPMQWVCGAGVMSGYPDGTLQPRAVATRAHVAQMLKNFLEK